ncbi:3'-5' exonuclease [Actinopolymorpha sp. B11F2]|uniref:3'-5' exonuclease n=1 Tax=Actinopolymorpha sp. B11F2 TaxID=3160862 RepID=UPI0032E3DD5F
MDDLTPDDVRYVVIDFEGTTPPGRPSAPIEVAALVLNPAGDSATSEASFEELIRPPDDAPVTPFDTVLKGITSADVQTARPPADVFTAIDIWLPNSRCLLVAHHASVEAGMIYRHREHCPALSTTPFLDTVRMAKAVLPGVGSYNLDQLLLQLRIPRPINRHRAMPDVHATAQLFRRLWGLGVSQGHWKTGKDALKIAGLTPQASRPQQTSLF